LSGERDLVLGRRQFLGELHHVLVGLEVGIALLQGEESTQGAREARLSAHEALHCADVPGVRGRPLPGVRGLAARSDDRFEGLALVLHVALRRLHEVRDEVVATLELHVDLRERVLVAVPEPHEGVVQTHHPSDDEQRQDEEDDEGDEECCHGFLCTTFPLANQEFWEASRFIAPENGLRARGASLIRQPSRSTFLGGGCARRSSGRWDAPGAPPWRRRRLHRSWPEWPRW